MPVDYTQQAQIAYLHWLAAEDKAGELFIRTVREYAGGEHPVYLTERQKEFLGLKAADGTHLFAHNLCQLVIDALVERLSVTGFAPQGQADAANAQMANWWEANRMDAGQSDVYEAAVRDGSAYLVVDWDAANARPRWTLNLQYDGTQGVALQRDPSTDAALFAVKRWQVYDPYNQELNGRTRMTLYFPNRVEKYISVREHGRGLGGGAWEPYADEGEAWPIPWMGPDGRPLGIAAVAFEAPGGSALAAIMPLQDMLNKSDLDLIAATDAGGFRILYASGVEAEIDPATKLEKTIKVGPGQLIRLSAPEARLGAIEPTDPKTLIAASDYWQQAIAGVSRTPQYLLKAMGADQPSGESLREQEAGLVHKAQRAQQVFGNAWEDVAYLSLRLAEIHSAGRFGEVRLSTQWALAERPDETKQTEALRLKRELGVPEEQLWLELGYTAEEVARFSTLRATEREAERAMGETLLTNFDRGEVA